MLVIMDFNSAYDQLQPNEREFVNGFIRAVERENALIPLERLTGTLKRVSATINADDLDSRTRDMFQKPLITAAIKERVEFLAAERDVSPEWVINQHRAIASANLQDFIEVGEDGFPWPNLEGLSREQWYALESVETTEEENKFGAKTKKFKIKLKSSHASLDKLGKFVGIDNENSAAYQKYAALENKAANYTDGTTIEQLADEYAQFING